MYWKDIHNKRCDDFVKDVKVLLTEAINALHQQQNACDVESDIERFETDLYMLESMVDCYRVHQLEFRTMRWVEHDFEYKVVVCPKCGHIFGSIIDGKFFEGGQTNCCPSCGRSFDWSIFNEDEA